jgi:hypothetical protein
MASQIFPQISTRGSEAMVRMKSQTWTFAFEAALRYEGKIAEPSSWCRHSVASDLMAA